MRSAASSGPNVPRRAGRQRELDPHRRAPAASTRRPRRRRGARAPPIQATWREPIGVDRLAPERVVHVEAVRPRLHQAGGDERRRAHAEAPRHPRRPDPARAAPRARRPACASTSRARRRRSAAGRAARPISVTSSDDAHARPHLGERARPVDARVDGELVGVGEVGDRVAHVPAPRRRRAGTSRRARASRARRRAPPARPRGRRRARRPGRQACGPASGSGAAYGAGPPEHHRHLGRMDHRHRPGGEAVVEVLRDHLEERVAADLAQLGLEAPVHGLAAR